MSEISNLTPGLPIAGEDLEGDLFKIANGKITGKTIAEVPPGSPGLITSAPAGVPPTHVLRADGTWGAATLATPTSSARRIYYTSSAPYVSVFPSQNAVQAEVPKFTAVGAGASVQYSTLGNTGASFVLALGSPPATLASQFTPPSGFVRHEVSVTGGVANAYHLKIRGVTYGCAEVWVCDPASGIPSKRLTAQSTFKVGDAGDGVSLYLGPNESYGLMNGTWEWVQWLIPEPVIASHRTATGMLKLAIRPGAGASNGYVDIAGYAVSAAGSSLYQVTTGQMWDAQMNGGARLTRQGALYGQPWSAVTATSNPASPARWPANLAAPGLRVPLTGVDRDVHLTMFAPSNLEYHEHRSIEVSLIHPSGTVSLDRGGVSKVGPLAAQLAYGPRSHLLPLGFVIPAATLQAKAVTPANSAIPYLEIGLTSWDTGVNYLSGALVETV